MLVCFGGDAAAVSPPGIVTGSSSVASQREAKVAGGDPNAWLDEVNVYRRAAGLVAVADQPAWSQGIRNHLVYLTNTPASYRTGPYASAHTENPASPYYTNSGSAAAGFSNLVFGTSSPVNAIDGWLTAPFHAIGMLRAKLRQVAFGRDSTTGGAGLDIIRGIDSSAAGAAGPILFPGPGATTDLSRYVGESPDPLETCSWTGRSDVGLPLIAMLPTSPSVSLTARVDGPGNSVRSTANGRLCVVDQHTYRSSDSIYGPTGLSILQGDRAVVLIPDGHLTNGTYTVRIDQPGAAPISWSFIVMLPVPQNTAVPTISGAPAVASTLYGSTGSWSNGPTAYLHQWQRCDAAGNSCAAITGAGGNSYTVTNTDIGRTLRYQATAANDGGSGTPAVSGATAAVVAPTPIPGNQGGSGPRLSPPTPGSTFDDEIQAPGRPGYSRTGTRITIRWLRVPGAERYRVRLRIAGRFTSRSTTLRYLVVRVKRRLTARATVRAIDSDGVESAPSRSVLVPRG